jgi:hypothetical protein
MQGQGMQWIASVATVILGLMGIWRGWQMRYRNRLDLISDWDSHPLPQPSAHAESFSRVYVRIGSALVGMPLMLWLGLPILIWAGIVAVIVWYWFNAIDAITDRARSVKQ